MRSARGEVWWYEPPHEKARPVLVLTRSQAVARLEKLVAVPATQTIRGLPTEVALGREDGMTSECVLTTDNITVVEKSFLTKRIARLAPDKMSQVCRALSVAVDC